MMEQPTLQESFGVGERARQQWFSRSEQAWEALQSAKELVMHRKLRAGAETVCKDISAIIRFCQSDPNAIREEAALPSLIEQVVVMLNDYVRTAGTKSLADRESPKLIAAQKLLDEAHSAFANLLGKMQTNNSDDFGLRLTAMSSVFRRMPGATTPGQSP